MTGQFAPAKKLGPPQGREGFVKSSEGGDHQGTIHQGSKEQGAESTGLRFAWEGRAEAGWGDSEGENTKSYQQKGSPLRGTQKRQGQREGIKLRIFSASMQENGHCYLIGAAHSGGRQKKDKNTII